MCERGVHDYMSVCMAVHKCVSMQVRVCAQLYMSV
jgi:hypothetical protein